MDAVPIGIDLGITSSSVAVFLNNRVHVIPNNYGNITTPNVVAYTNDEGVLVGETARKQRDDNPENTVSDVTRLIGRMWTDPILQEYTSKHPLKLIREGDLPKIELCCTESTLSPEDVCAEILRNLKEMAADFLQVEEVREAVIAVPAYFTNAQIEATKLAAKNAELNVLSIITKPIAASTAYQFKNKIEGDTTFLVYSMGSETFEVTVSRIIDKQIEVLATSGSINLGGKDIDNNMVDDLIKRILMNDGKDLEKDNRAISILQKHCEIAKRRLSKNRRQTTIEIPELYDGKSFTTVVTKDQLNTLNNDLFQSTMEKVNDILNQAKITTNDVDHVILVGGSTRIPKIRFLLGDVFKPTPNTKINPEEIIVYGTAIYATVSPKSPSRTDVKVYGKQNQDHASTKKQLPSQKDVDVTFDKVEVEGNENRRNIVGRGATSTVFSGKKSGISVALKQFQTGYYIDRIMKREKSTFEAIEPLRRANIIGYYGRFEDQENAINYLVLELCDCTLEHLVTNDQTFQQLPFIIDTCDIIKQAMNGVCGLHEIRIAHRDIKPSNILLKKETGQPRPIVKITDFGFSRKYDQDLHNTTLLGGLATAGWTAPEMATKDRDERSDVFSLGLVIYYLFSSGSDNHFLFGNNNTDAQNNIGTRNSSYKDMQLKELKGTERNLIDEMTSLDPEHRPCIAKCMSHPLLMDATGQMQMITRFSDETKCESDQSNTAREGFNGMLDMVGEWDQYVGPELKTEVNKIFAEKKRQPRYIDLVRLIRNKYVHKGEIKIDKENLHQELWGTGAGFDDSVYLSYFTQRFPELIVDVWKASSEYLLDEMQQYHHTGPCRVNYCYYNTD